MDKPQYALDFEKPLRELEKQLDQLESLSSESQVDVSREIAAIEKKIEATKRNIYSGLTSWQKVQLARHPARPYALDYMEKVFTGFQELHGDRLYRDDAAIVGGPAWLDGQPVMVIGQHKGRNTKEKISRNFGMAHPEGYRKALRLMRLAETFNLPVITLIDTAGAYPGIGAEERHVAEAIAHNIQVMSALRTPIIAAIIGEGGSGGALGLGVGDRILIFENAWYSVISPEGCAAILWKDRAHAEDAAQALKLNAGELLNLKIVDEVIEEPLGGAHLDPDRAAELLKKALIRHLDPLLKDDAATLVEKRYQRYRHIGKYTEEKQAEVAEEAPPPAAASRSDT
ncbi:MAG: acetyl-CoA carboxylase carboxyltransferase subunit alpha [Opitutales bacterium]